MFRKSIKFLYKIKFILYRQTCNEDFFDNKQ
jgi:hypothetical protein